MFRKEIREQTPLGKRIQPIVESGQYVDNEIVCSLIAEQLTEILAQGKCFILDGFPRAQIAFDFLHQFFKDRDLMQDVCFIQLTSKDQTCIERILHRIVCPTCSMVYHRACIAPKQANICDACGAQLVARIADTEDIVKKRLAFFHAEIEPLLNIAQEFYEVCIIETECSIQNVRDTYDKLVEQMRDRGDV